MAVILSEAKDLKLSEERFFALPSATAQNDRLV